MHKDTTNSSDMQEKKSFSFSKARFSKSLNVDFDTPDISSNGGLMLCNMQGSLAAKIGKALPNSRQKAFVDHPYEEMVYQRVGQIMCGYEDANNCDSLRHDSVLKLAVGRKPSDKALSSQPTMTRMENGISKETFCEKHQSSYSMVRLTYSLPKKSFSTTVVRLSCCPSRQHARILLLLQSPEVVTLTICFSSFPNSCKLLIS